VAGLFRSGAGRTGRVRGETSELALELNHNVPTNKLVVLLHCGDRCGRSGPCSGDISLQVEAGRSAVF
jgi:hypothetical protein